MKPPLMIFDGLVFPASGGVPLSALATIGLLPWRGPLIPEFISVLGKAVARRWQAAK